jgi:hypothetical protein
MGTRSRIAVMHGDVCKSVYCHYDGYLDGVGKTLLNHYDSSKANQMVALGDLSSLRPEIGEAHPFSPFDLPPELAGMSLTDYNVQFGNMCTFYGRDRGEKHTEWQVAHTFEEFIDQCDNSGAEYYYVMKDGVWYCGDMYNNIFEGTGISRGLTPLTEAVSKVKQAS